MEEVLNSPDTPEFTFWIDDLLTKGTKWLSICSRTDAGKFAIYKGIVWVLPSVLFPALT